ncbi:MAG: NAD(+) synthase [Oscillospiraceae bacterium]|nr:NAD(+) synthase [Oscillospiraceae bacterium]
MGNFGFVKTGALSPRITVANPQKNAVTALEAIRVALLDGVQAVVLPELYLSGCSCGDLFGQPVLLDACEAALDWLLEQTRQSPALVVLGLPVRANERLYNCAAVIQQGKLLGVVPKQHLGSGEKRWFSPAAPGADEVRLCGRGVPFGRLLFCCGNKLSVGVELGGELWSPAPPSVEMALQGAQLILNPAAQAEAVAHNGYRRALIAQQSARLCCGYIYAGAGPGESSTDTLFSGACFVAENGRVLTESRRFEQEGSAVYHCVDLELLRAERRFGLFGDEARENRGPLRRIPCAALPKLREAQISRKYAPLPFVPEGLLARTERCREIFEIQTAALVNRLRHTGQSQMILGISGGLDSTLALLVALRAAKALQWPPERVLGITMPGFGTTQFTRETVDRLARALGITLWEIDIRPACELHMQDIGHNPEERDTTYENIQARERTQILMDLANQENALLLGTGDLSELALGWCTYNGDHMSMYGLNGGVPKTMVRHLVEYAMDEGDEAAAQALRRVLETPISPELLPLEDLEEGEYIDIPQSAQQTEDILGKYEVHDFYLYYFFRFGFSPEKLFFMARRAFTGTYAPGELKEWLLIFLRRFFSQQFKRSCLPDGPKIGSVCLSPREGWRMPSDAAGELWIRRAEELEI